MDWMESIWFDRGRDMGMEKAMTKEFVEKAADFALAY